MLVLARKEGESIMIGDDIKLKVISIDKNSVKLGIDAPNEVTILREELLAQVATSNKESTSSYKPEKLSLLSKLFNIKK